MFHIGSWELLWILKLKDSNEFENKQKNTDAAIWGLSYQKTNKQTNINCKYIFMLDIPTLVQPEITTAMMVWWFWQKYHIEVLIDSSCICHGHDSFLFTNKCIFQLFTGEVSSAKKAGSTENIGEFLTQQCLRIKT